jgi:hypothetical protein
MAKTNNAYYMYALVPSCHDSTETCERKTTPQTKEHGMAHTNNAYNIAYTDAHTGTVAHSMTHENGKQTKHTHNTQNTDTHMETHPDVNQTQTSVGHTCWGIARHIRRSTTAFVAAYFGAM